MDRLLFVVFPVRVGSDGHMGSIPGGNRLVFPVEFQLNTYLRNRTGGGREFERQKRTA